MSRIATVRVAVAATVFAAAVLAVALARALHVDTTVPLVGSPAVPELGPPFPAGAAIPGDAVLTLAADRNPFHPERRRGGIYRLPGSQVAPAAPEEALSAALGPVTLVGTAVGEGGRGFVVCRVGRESPRIVRLDGSCGDLVLETVEQGRASFRDAAGERVLLEVPKAGTD